MTEATRLAEILKTLHAAFARKDMDTIGRHFHADIRFVNPDGELSGRQARVADEQRIFDLLDNGYVEVTSTFIRDVEAVEVCILHGDIKIGANAGKKLALRYVAHYRFARETIIFQEIVFDRAALAEQLT